MMKKKNSKKKIISLDEFFRYKEMFEGLPEDKALACELYNNAGYADKAIVDRLMAKALMFDDRVKFCIGIKYEFTIGSFKTTRIYTFIKKEKVNKIYMDILRKLKDHD